MSLRFILIFCGIAHSFALLSNNLQSIVNTKLIPSDLAKMKAVDPNWKGEGIFNKITPVAGFFAHKETNEIILETKEKLWMESEIVEDFLSSSFYPGDHYYLNHYFLKTNNWSELFCQPMKTDKLDVYWNKAMAEIVDVNAADIYDKETVLMRAVKNHRNDLVSTLLERDANVNAKDENVNPKTALRYAADKNNVEAINLLLKYGANIDAIDNTARTPLMWAVRFSQTDVFKALLKHKARVDMKDETGWTALHHAVDKNNVEAIGLLLKYGANIDAIDNFARTPLMWAVRFSHTDAFKALLKHNARVDMKDEDGLLEAQKKKDREPKKIEKAISNTKNWFSKLCGKTNKKKKTKPQNFKK